MRYDFSLSKLHKGMESVTEEKHDTEKRNPLQLSDDIDDDRVMVEAGS